MTRRVLVVRLDSVGDVLLSGPAVRALARDAEVDYLSSGIGRPAAALLPGVRHVLRFDAPWVLRDGPPVERRAIDALIEMVAARGYDAAAVLTSSHQSPLPIALVLRLAGVRRLAAVSVDYPGNLLDHRIPGDPDVHEVERGLLVAAALDACPPDPCLLAVHGIGETVVRSDRVVIHPGSTAPARTLDPPTWRAAAQAVAAAGFDVVVSGAAHEGALVDFVTGSRAQPAVFAAGDLAGLAGLLASAAVVVTGNTGPMHLAAAVGRPVVAAFAPTVPPARWRPWGVPHRLLGDLGVPCAGCRQLQCPFDEQRCLVGIDAAAVSAAVTELLVAAEPTMEVVT